MLGKQLAAIYEAADLHLPSATRQQLFREIIDEIVGYGPLEPLLGDPDVSEIMVNGPAGVYAERKGKLTRTDTTFDGRRSRPAHHRSDHPPRWDDGSTARARWSTHGCRTVHASTP